MSGYPLLIVFGALSLGAGLSWFYKVSLSFSFILLISFLLLSLRWRATLIFALVILGMLYAGLRAPSDDVAGRVDGVFEVHGSLATSVKEKFYLSRYLKDGIYKIEGSSGSVPLDKRSYLWCRGFYLMLNVEKISLIKPLSDSLLKRLTELYPEDVAYFLYGAMSGDKRGLPTDLKSIVYRSGIGHLLAISGLHVGILAGALYILLGTVGFSPRITLILSNLLLIPYLHYIGFQPSALRAYLLFLFCSLGKLLGLKVSLLNALGACGLALFIWNPFVVWDAGFQLSFSAFFFIALSLERKLPPYMVYLSPQLGTFPILAIRFSYIPIASLLSNFIAVPLFSLALPLSVLSLIPFVGEFLAPIVSFIIEFIFFISMLSLKLLPSINL